MTGEGIAGAVLEIVAAAAALAKGYMTEWNLPFAFRYSPGRCA